jgi:integrase
VENDIYDNKAAYEYIRQNLDEFCSLPEKGGKRKYYCKNKDNLIYFRLLFKHFEAKDLSYIRRKRLIDSLKPICHVTYKDLKALGRDDVDEIVAFMNGCYSPDGVSKFKKDIKYIWKLLFPEKDEKGRIDENLVPYPVRHLKSCVDKSRQKRRLDRFTIDEFNSIISYFSADPRLQAFLTLSFESLGRPQEILYLKIRDVELFDNYSKVWVSEHGKECIGMLQSIDSHPYLARWLDIHPRKNDTSTFLFVNLEKNFGKQLSVDNINKKLKTACRKIRITKPITCYSFKRNGVTFRRLRGDTDVEIQHAARWTSSKQLKTYDMSNQEDAFNIQLTKRGIIKDNSVKQTLPPIKKCIFCKTTHGFTETTCKTCNRPLDRKKIQEQINMYEKMQRFIEYLENNPEIAHLIESKSK